MVKNQEVALSPVQAKNVRRLVWAFAAGFILHNLEELLRMQAFISAHAQEFPQFFQQITSQLNPQVFPLAIWSLNIAAIVLAWFITRRLSNARLHLGLSFFATLMTFNVLSHITQSLYLQRLAPGVVTAVLLILPCCLAILRMERHNGWLSQKQLVILAGISLPAMLLLIGLILSFTSWLVG
jgi:hypothetical protein